MGVGVIVSAVHNKDVQTTAMSNAANDLLKGLEIEAPYWMGLLSSHRQLSHFAQSMTYWKQVHTSQEKASSVHLSLQL